MQMTHINIWTARAQMLEIAANYSMLFYDQMARMSFWTGRAAMWDAWAKRVNTRHSGRKSNIKGVCNE